MRVSLLRSYRSKNGNPTFVYGVTGSKDELAEYKEAQGTFYREDDNGTPLWFTTRCIGDNGKLIITTNGKIVPDMSKYDQAASLAQQYGGNFGQELAKNAAQQLTGTAPTPDAAPAQQSTPAETSTEASSEEASNEDMGDM